MHKFQGLLVVFAALGVMPRVPAEEDAKVKALIDKVTSQDIEVRYAARAEAPQVGAPAVAALAKLLDETTQQASGDAGVQRYRREVALTAKAALEKIVHFAGRPGADAEKKQVATELARVLTPDQSPKAKMQLLHFVAFIGGDDEIPAIAKLLDDGDRNVRETARLALQRMTGPAATQALVNAAKAQADDRKPELIMAVGWKGDPAALPMLLDFAKDGKGPIRLAALKALAHLGSAEAIPAFSRALEERDMPGRNQVFNEVLRLADNLAAEGKTDDAKGIYQLALKESPLDHQRERALFQLSRDAGNMEVLLAGLADPAERVRGLALWRITALKGGDVLPALLKAYESAKPESRATLLRVISEKDNKAAEPLLAEAAGSPQPELKLTALDIQGRLDDPQLEPVLLKAAEGGSPVIKPVAMKGLLLVAKKRLDAGEKDKALQAYSRVLELAAEPELRVAALKGVIAVGDPKALDQVGGLLKDSALANEAARGLFLLAAKIGAAGNKDKAAGSLMQIVTGEFPKDLRNQAVEELKKMGRDPQEAVRSQGFVLDWWLLTPIEDPDGKGLETEYFPEKVIDLVNEQRIGPRKFRWQKLTEVSLDGRINLLTSFRKTEKVLTYAYSELESPSEKEVVFKMGSDDGIACWLNGQRIHLNNAARGLQVDEDVVKGKLAAGKNRILLKISNTGGDWGFVFRVTDPDGKPLILAPAKR